jgi:NAD(P)-dependent dehydrogenase (short-subunit alcohol dehydrogenase family)
MELNGKTAIVTGSSGGIGRALALEFGRQGMNVVCAARRLDALKETAAMVEEADGEALAVATDVTDREQVRRMVAAAVERFGQVDVLFNNAATFQAIGGVWEVEPEEWWRDVTVNLYGPLLCIREVLPHMMERDEGVIINMDGGRPKGGTAYACGKAGLVEMTRLLVEELRSAGSRVMVFNASPGLVRTPMTERMVNDEMAARWIPQVKEGLESGSTRRPEEIARATVELLRVARPEISGFSYYPGTDFAAL